MKKTIPTSIGQTLFYIEEDTYSILDEYLKAIRQYFAHYPDNIEIIQDIESRIREQLLEQSGTDRIVTAAHIEQLIKTMGRPEEFDDEAGFSGEPISPSPKTRKKLYRDPDTAMFAGVAAGIGAYFGIDSTIVRVAFAVSVFFGGLGIWVYLILWFAVPQALTPTQKLEMHGDAMTLTEVKKVVEEKIGELGDKENMKHGVRNFFTHVFSFLGIVGTRLWHVLKQVIGVALTFAALVGSVALIVLFTVLIIHPVTSVAGIAIPAFFSPVSYYIIGLLWFVCAFIPLLFLAEVGSFLQGKKVVLRAPIRLVLVTLWLFAITFGGLLAVRIGGSYVAALKNSPAFQTVTATPEVKPFDQLVVEDGIRVTITQENTQNKTQNKTATIAITGAQRSIDETALQYNGGVLTIRHLPRPFPCILCYIEPARITITAPDITALTAKNGSSVSFNGTVDTIDITAQNGSLVSLSGAATSMDVTLHNGSRLNASTFTVDTVHVNLTNGSDAELKSMKTLEGNLNNASVVTQYGTAPTQTLLTHNGSYGYTNRNEPVIQE